MNIIELDNVAKLPRAECMIGHVACSLEEAVAAHTHNWGTVRVVYQVTRQNGKRIYYIPKEDET